MKSGMASKMIMWKSLSILGAFHILITKTPHSFSGMTAGGLVAGKLADRNYAVTIAEKGLSTAAGRGWFFTMFSLFVGVLSAVCALISRKKGMLWRQQRLAASPAES